MRRGRGSFVMGHLSLGKGVLIRKEQGHMWKYKVRLSELKWGSLLKGEGALVKVKEAPLRIK